MEEKIQPSQLDTHSRSWVSGAGGGSLSSVTLDQSVVETKVQHVSTELGELDRVLGGGFVPGSFILLGGDPGIGKSTLLMQVVGYVANAQKKSLYVSAEESVAQSALRAQRLGVRSPLVEVASMSQMEQILEKVVADRPDFLVIDSIQTVYLEGLESAPGSVSQVRECAARLLTLAKTQGITVILIGHVTKEGNIAGPKVLEHMVDTVLSFEGDGNHQYRLLRTLKNRFGTTHELGVFEMVGSGLKAVSNPSELFLAERGKKLVGSAIYASMEGSRPLLCEVQTLAVKSYLPMPRRTSLGFDLNRVHLQCAVLDKHAGLNLAQHDVFVNVVGGLKLIEPGADLAVIASMISSLRDFAMDAEMCFLGEVGLTGEVRPVSFAEIRVKEALKLGFRKFFLPRGNKKHLEELVAEMRKEKAEALPQFVFLENIGDLTRYFSVGSSKRASASTRSAPQEQDLEF